VAVEAHTFIFMDLVGFTALSAERGDHGAADVAYRFYGHVRELLPGHLAEEIKTIGDAMMLRGDDPQLAICLGLRVVDELEARGLPPVRVGVHTGSAVCRDGDWYGGAVNVAARLCSSAGGGEVLVSEATHQAAGSLRRVRLGERQLHWLKNVPEPVAARPAFEHQCSPRRPLRMLGSKLARIRPPGQVAVQRPEAIG
jgi:class 3 adenylate cyclase